jgi:hypothetical protein
MNLRTFMRIIRRCWKVVALATVLCCGLGVAYTILRPPLPVSEALIVLPPATRNIGTEVVIASSNPVLTRAMQEVNPGVSLSTFRSRVQVTSLTSGVVEISAHGATAAQAEETANDVADSYISYVGAPSSPGGLVSGHILQRATTATAVGLGKRVTVYGGLAALLGALLGAVAAVSISYRDRRLRLRDDIADAIGVPVLASIPTGRPADAASWLELLERYTPGAVHAWSLRKAMQLLELSDGTPGSVAVVSIGSDKGALALGPQLAAFAAGLGIHTELVVGPQQDADATATLRTACAMTSAQSLSHLLRVSDGNDNFETETGVALTVVVAVVDSRAPRLANTMRTSTTILGVSAGAVTAEQLARVAVSAASDGRDIAGIIVANPDSTDRSTGRLPQATRALHRKLPTRLGSGTETTS